MPHNGDSKEQYNYQELSTKLDEIVAKLQDSNIELDDALEYYKEASILIKKLEKYLDQAETQIHEITRKF